MGCEVGQSGEWNANGNVDWWLLDQGPYHRGVQRLVRDLNRFYRDEPALFETDFDVGSFFWIDCGDSDSSVLSFSRKNLAGDRKIVVILNLTPVLREGYRVGLPDGGYWREVVNSDSGYYGGSNQGNFGGVNAEPYPCHGQSFSASFTLPPMSVLVFRRE
jgi:1,4-alpha-glucan branching enzyme